MSQHYNNYGGGASSQQYQGKKSRGGGYDGGQQRQGGNSHSSSAGYSGGKHGGQQHQQHGGQHDPGQYQGTNMTKTEFFKKQDEIPVEVSPAVPDLQLLQDFGHIPQHWQVAPQLLKNCDYQRPTPVQKYGIPLALRGYDIMASAQTGSGKTCFFLFPSISKLLNNSGRNDSTITMQVGNESRRVAAPKVLVMAPTRELCQQIAEEAEKFCRGTHLLLACVYGGIEYRTSKAAVARGNDIIIATPGRLEDMADRKDISLTKINMLILDEADRMLDIGFEPQIRSIVQKRGMPKSRQTLMTSATFPEGVQFLAQDFLRDYIFVAVGQVGAAASTIRQKIVWVDDDDKDAYLYGILLHQRQVGLVLVFVNTKQAAADLERFLGRMYIRTTSIHGDKDQRKREEALEQFKNKQKPVMIATDVAARGLDIPNVALVVQYDCALSSDDFVHRIGRTGRIGNQGLAITFMNNRNKGNAHEILEKVEKSGNVAPNWLKGMAISTGNFGQTENKEPENGHAYGGQDFRKHTTGGFKTAAERDEAKKFKNFDSNAYGEGDASRAANAQREIAPEAAAYDHMPTGKGGKNRGGGKNQGKGGGGGGKNKGGGGGNKGGGGYYGGKK
ncbi:unnamed protein product [Amoebophrya sp. A25]|nr:unnamed protein product [Amoebophrya sp. A25]|eukprot:GSA25T00004213001.1